MDEWGVVMGPSRERKSESGAKESRIQKISAREQGEEARREKSERESSTKSQPPRNVANVSLLHRQDHPSPSTGNKTLTERTSEPAGEKHLPLIPGTKFFQLLTLQLQ
eukprot:1282041-Rhodomonas_salina.1